MSPAVSVFAHDIRGRFSHLGRKLAGHVPRPRSEKESEVGPQRQRRMSRWRVPVCAFLSESHFSSEFQPLTFFEILAAEKRKSENDDC
eukprot:6257918-Pyramimonas_sp.AAC.1